MRVRRIGLFLVWLASATAFACVGCGPFGHIHRNPSTPAQAGLNTRDLIDPPAQHDADRLLNISSLISVSDDVRKMVVEKANQADPDLVNRPQRNVLCLSGGGAYGAFSAGLLVGWTATGTRPEFDTVTGISTGALIAPLAFLGSKYDDDMKRFYTEIQTRDIYLAKDVDSTSGRPNSKRSDSSSGTSVRLRVAKVYRAKNSSSKFCSAPQQFPDSSRRARSL